MSTGAIRSCAVALLLVLFVSIIGSTQADHRTVVYWIDFGPGFKSVDIQTGDQSVFLQNIREINDLFYDRVSNSLLLSDNTTGDIVRTNIRGENSDFVTLSGGRVTGIVVDPFDESIIWLTKDGSVFRCVEPPCYTFETLFFSGDDRFIKSPVIDSENRHLYFTGGLNRTITRLNLDTLEFEELAASEFSSIVWPVGVALDIEGGYMYVADLGDATPGTGAIVRCKIPEVGATCNDVAAVGSFNPIEVVIAGINGPRTIAIDSESDSLYWTDDDKIKRANLDGTEVETLVDVGHLIIVIQPAHLSLGEF